MSSILSCIVLWFVVIDAATDDWYNCPQNENACKSADCTAEQAATRSRIMCNEFPFYAGSLDLYNYPSQWSSVNQMLSHCNNAHNSTNPYCNSWTQFASNYASECKCTNNNHNHTFCVSWQCHYTAQNIIFSQCDCHNHSDISYCSSWTCNNTHSDEPEYSLIEYNCISDKPMDPRNAYYSEYMLYQNNTNHSFCWNWIGTTLHTHTQQTNWSVVNCECEIPKLQAHFSHQNNAEQVNNLYCDAWICYHKSMDYYHVSELQFHLSWAIATCAGMVLCVSIYSTLKYGVKDEKTKCARITKPCCNVFCIISLFTLLFWSFMYGSTCSALITAFIWNLCAILMIVAISMRWCFQMRQNRRLNEARYDFQKQRDQHLPRMETQGSFFRYSHTESDTDFDF